ncbi:hypothetical protein OIO90_002268 [Microbotryomycetes sp. JL221]|nr:hypothetical protein OIO90_002268 [Microbotryomycetes sp. JL221]
MAVGNILALSRTVLYGITIFTSFLAWILAAAFTGRTPAYFASPVVVLVAGLFANIVLPPLHFLIHRRSTASVLGSVGVEVGILFVLWMLFVGGAGGMADRLPLNSSFCDSSLCSLGRATEAFAWITWICITLLLAMALYGLISGSRTNSTAWRDPLVFSGSGETSSKGISSNSAPAQQPPMQQQAPSYPPNTTV